MAPTYPPSGAAAEYPSPASRRQSECFSEMSNSRRGSSAGFVSEMESKGQWQSIGSDSNSKSPLANFGFFKSLSGEKKTTRGMTLYDHVNYLANCGQMDSQQRGEAPSLIVNLP
jgi:hypothetical protein